MPMQTTPNGGKIQYATFATLSQPHATSVPKILAGNPGMSPSPQQRPGRGRALCPPVPPRQTTWPPCLHPARPCEGPRWTQCQGTDTQALSSSSVKAFWTESSGDRALRPECPPPGPLSARGRSWPPPRLACGLLHSRTGSQENSLTRQPFPPALYVPFLGALSLCFVIVPWAFLWGPRAGATREGGHGQLARCPQGLRPAQKALRIKAAPLQGASHRLLLRDGDTKALG